jgi:hypothetical protein
MTDLEAQEGKLRALAAEVRQALAAGEGMSTALGQTLVTFDALMKRFGVGEPRPPATATSAGRRPFDIRDFAATAKEITTMAAQLDATLKDLSLALDSPSMVRRKQELDQLADEVQHRARRTLNHAFMLAAGLVVLGFLCVLAYRWLARADRCAGSGAHDGVSPG